MDAEIPVLTGYLNVPTQSGFSLNRISKKKPCHRLCLLFKASRHGIERLEICETKEDKNPKIITLENCVKISQESSPANLIHIVKKTGTLTLNALNEDDLKDWVNALQTVAFQDKSHASGSHVAIEEDNDLYCSSFGDGLFIITLMPTETSIRCNIEPKPYMLHLTATELQLKSAEDLSIIIAKWPYRFIRKYGYRNGKFTFEAGRKCFTGEGVFTLDHSNPQEVFRLMVAKMRSMKKLVTGDSISSIESGESQLSIAATMEAGSRSPLPPSPSNQHPTEFEVNSSQSSILLRGFISSSDSLNACSVASTTTNSNNNNNQNSSSSISTNSNNNINSNSSHNTNQTAISNANPVKHTPNKPPRKLPSPMPKSPHSGLETKSGGADKFKKYQNYDPVSITTCIDSTKSVGSSVILKPTSPDLFRKLSSPPHLPVRNESAKNTNERDYECIENITEAWKTLGLGEVRHTERIADGSVEFAVPPPRGLQRDNNKAPLKEVLPSVKASKIIDIDIGEGKSASNAGGNAIEATYDRLDFLSPNNNTSSGYKTIVTVSSAVNRLCFSPQIPNDYELIASPDIQSCRKADDSHLGYGILRKSVTGYAKAIPTATAGINGDTNSAASNTAPILAPGLKTEGKEGKPDQNKSNGIDYTIVSKPKRV